MARSFRGSRFPRVGGQSRRLTSWDIGTQTGTDGASLGLSSSVAIIGGGAFTPISDGLTLLRTRGELLVLLKTASVAGAGFFGAFGIGVATAAAVAIGISAVPTPITEEEWDGWLYHRYFSITATGVGTGSPATVIDQEMGMAGVFRHEVDSKAMRKLKEEDAVYCALELTESGTATGTWFFNSRSLVALP